MVANTSNPSRTVRFRIKRCDGPGRPSYWQSFDVPVERGSNIISCLQWIAAHPRTVSDEDTTPVVYDSGCLEEVCGSCTMLVNGSVRQSCSALIDDVAPPSNPVVTLEPMSKFPVVRDLFVDRSRMFHALKKMRAWVPIDGTWDLGPGPKSTPEEQQRRYKLQGALAALFITTLVMVSLAVS